MVIVWDVESVAKRFRIAAHEDWVMDAQFSDDDKSILTCSRDGSVRIWNIERTDELPVVFEERRSIGLRLVKVRLFCCLPLLSCDFLIPVETFKLN